MPLLWIRVCSRDFSNLWKVQIALLRWLNIHPVIYLNDILDWKNVRGNFNEQRHIDFSVSASGFCHKSEKISSEPSYYDFGTNRGKDGKGNFKMSEYPFSPSNHCFGINKIDRSDVLNYPRNSTSSSTAKV